MITLLKTIQRNKLLFLFSAVLDFVFFFLLAQLHYRIFFKAAQHLKIVLEMLTKNVSQLSIADVQQPDILNDAQFLLHYHEVLKWIFFLLLGFYLLWLILRGTTWWLAHKIAKTKITGVEYVKRFFIITTVGTILFFSSIILFVSLMNYVMFNLLPLITPTIAQGLTFAIMLFLHYCYSASMARINLSYKKLLTFDVQHIIKYLASILWYILATSAAMMISRTNFYAGLAFVAVIIVPSITYFRLLLIRATEA